MPCISKFALNSYNKIWVWHGDEFFECLCSSKLFFSSSPLFSSDLCRTFRNNYTIPEAFQCYVWRQLTPNDYSLSYHYALVNVPFLPHDFYWNRQYWSVGLRQLACWGYGFESLRGDMHVCHLWVLCVVRYRPLLWADHSSRGVLPIAMCLLWSRNLNNEKDFSHDICRAMK